MEMMKSLQEMRSCCFTTFDCETTLRVKSVENQFRSVEFWSKVSLQVGCNSLHQRVLLFWWHRMSLLKRCKVSCLLILKSKVVVVKSQREDYLWKSVGKGRRQSIQQMLPLLKMSWWWLGWWFGWWRLECGRQEVFTVFGESVTLVFQIWIFNRQLSSTVQQLDSCERSGKEMHDEKEKTRRRMMRTMLLSLRDRERDWLCQSLQQHRVCREKRRAGTLLQHNSSILCVSLRAFGVFSSDCSSS